MTRQINVKPPRPLSEAGKDLWQKVTAVAKFEDPRETHALFNACQFEDDIARCRKELEGSPLTVQGSTGQPVENPLLGSIRNATLLQQRLLASIAHEESNASAAGRQLVSTRYA